MRISDWSSDVCSSDLIITECGRSGRAEGVSSPQPVLRLSEEGDQRREEAHSGDKARHAPNGHGVDRLFHVGFGRYVLHGDLLYRQREGFGNPAVETSFLKELCDAEGVESCGVHICVSSWLVRSPYGTIHHKNGR